MFDDFSLSVAPGETVALVGHTGSGKSSITKLVARFYEYQKGEILVDGHDIRSLDLAGLPHPARLRDPCAFLFNGSVLDNIRYGRSDAGDAEVTAAGAPCGRRRLDRHVTGWADHGGGGARAQPVAGPAPAHRPGAGGTAGAGDHHPRRGHRQRGSVHRGADSGRARRAAARPHRHGDSRPPVHIKQADRIVVLRSGRIIEEGSHQRLARCRRPLRRVVNTYFRHQSLEYVQAAGA